MEGFSKSKAYRNYYENCKKEREFFKKHGLSDENIEIVMNLTHEQFNGDCVHYEHNYSLDAFVDDMGEEGMNLLFDKKIDEYSFIEDKLFYESYVNSPVNASWINYIENEKLSKALKKLSSVEKNILIEIAINGRKIKDVAEIVGLTRQWTAVKYDEILEKIRKTMLSN